MMKKAVNFSLALMLIVGTTAWAQPDQGHRGSGHRGSDHRGNDHRGNDHRGNDRRGGNPTERAERLTASMTELLSLNEEQQTQVGDLNLEYAMKMQETRKESQGDRETMRDTMMALNQEKEEKLATILSEEQMQVYQDKKDEFIRKARERRGRRQGRGKKESSIQ